MKGGVMGHSLLWRKEEEGRHPHYSEEKYLVFEGEKSSSEFEKGGGRLALRRRE